jgi:hypothetical protein
MADENQSAPPDQPFPIPSSPSLPNATATQQQIVTELHKFFGEATKYTVFAIFALYSIGFIIWHSYLGSYGVSSIAFLQAEYLAAAFCYLFILATFAVPPILLAKAVGRNIKEKGFRRIKEWDKGWVIVVSLWSYLSSKALSVFLPKSQAAFSKHFIFIEVLAGIAAFHLLLCMTFAAFVFIRNGHLKEFLFGQKERTAGSKYNWRQSKFYKIAINSEYISFYLLAFLLLELIFNSEVDGAFLFSTMTLYLAASGSIVVNLPNTWKTSGAMMRTLIFVASCLLLVSNIQLFSTSQFGKIPKSVGGGKPETAYFKFSPQHLDVAASMNIPTATNIGLSSEFMGPVGLLLRSEKEIIFINFGETNSPEYLTNEVLTTTTTNLISVPTTNFSSYPIGKHDLTTTPQVTAAISTNVTKNIFNNIFKNPTKLTARQVRSDLVDSIIFTR